MEHAGSATATTLGAKCGGSPLLLLGTGGRSGPSTRAWGGQLSRSVLETSTLPKAAEPGQSHGFISLSMSMQETKDAKYSVDTWG